MRAKLILKEIEGLKRGQQIIHKGKIKIAESKELPFDDALKMFAEFYTIMVSFPNTPIKDKPLVESDWERAMEALSEGNHIVDISVNDENKATINRR